MNVDASAGVHVVASACVDVDIARNERSLKCVAESTSMSSICVNVDASADVHVVASACVDVDVDVVASACVDVVASVDVVVNAGSTK